MTYSRRTLLVSASLLFLLPAGGCISEGATGEPLGGGEFHLAVTEPPVPLPPVEIDPLPAACTPPPDGTRPDPTVVITDAAVLSRFPLQRVWQQLVELAGTGGAQTPLLLHQQLWDSLQSLPDAFPDAPHCHTPFNGFPLNCPRPESHLAVGDTMALFTPVALFNRFDLAPKDGGHCGEYRIVFAKRPFAEFDRAFIIFEGILPNPNPSCGIESCRPVVDFWEGLAAFDPATRGGLERLASGLDQLYFTGLPGFEPVVHPSHYGATGEGGYGARGGGQIRLNLFHGLQPNQTWQLREYHLEERCSGITSPVEPVPLDPLLPVLEGAVEDERREPVTRPPLVRSCKLVMQPVTVKNNPYGGLFDATSPLELAPAFQATFPSQVAALAGTDPNSIAMGIEDVFNAGQSTSLPRTVLHKDDYFDQFLNGVPPNAFSAAIEAQLAAIGRKDLTADDVVRRALTQSCAGCHRFSNGTLLGGDVRWPRSRDFVHVDEDGFLSPALWCEFLPFRKRVLDGVATARPMMCDVAKQQPSGTTVADRPTGTAN